MYDAVVKHFVTIKITFVIIVIVVVVMLQGGIIHKCKSIPIREGSLVLLERMTGGRVKLFRSL